MYEKLSIRYNTNLIDCAKKIFCILVFVSISGCANISKKVAVAESFNMNEAYIFVGFQESNCRAGAVGLEITGQEKKNKYILKSQRDMAASLYSVSPGRYKLANLIALSMGNEIQATVPLNGFPYGTEFEVTKGKAYYIGNHLGSCSFGLSGLNMSLAWRITFKGFEYDKAVSELSVLYPEFATIEKLSAFNAVAK